MLYIYSSLSLFFLQALQNLNDLKSHLEQLNKALNAVSTIEDYTKRMLSIFFLHAEILTPYYTNHYDDIHFVLFFLFLG